MATRVVKVDVDRRRLWSSPEAAAMLGSSEQYLRDHLVDRDGHKVSVAEAVDGNCWVDFEGIALIPVRLNHNRELRFVPAQVDAAFAARGLTLADQT